MRLPGAIVGRKHEAMIELVPMTVEEFAAFAAATVPAYAADKVAAGEWKAATAPKRAGESFARLLPQGLATPDHFLFTIRDAAGQVTVGSLWLALRDRGGQRIA